ncbi:MAG: site-specific DNA-methyltransferase [Candidatus Ancillula sp.]|jgi:adenine-specific DNA-methyltransferase|nr:site-specific DNA-methyltransferase [Candidatus Ancillula sp.]
MTENNAGVEKLAMETEDESSKNSEWLAEVLGEKFPEVVTEVRETVLGADGKPEVEVVDGVEVPRTRVKHAIEFEKLAELLGSEVAGAGRTERYDFTWPGKREAIREAATPIKKTLRPQREESVDWENTENVYIEGDNLEALKLLQESYLGKVKMIYIDPPYNTGKDFVYRDKFQESAEDYEEKLTEAGELAEDESGAKVRLFQNSKDNGCYHSDWCSMIYPRLKLARNLLRDDGVIFISIDDNEVTNLRKICDEVFGEGNFAACIPWQSRLSVQNDTDLSINHEYILVYAKQRRFENRRLKESNASSWYKHDLFVFRPSPLDKSKFNNPDNDPRGPWKADPFDAPHVRPNLTYPVTNPNTGEQHLPPSGRHWRISPDKFSSAMEEKRIVFGKSGTGRPQMKSFYEEKKDFGSIDNAWFSADKVGTATEATKELQKLFDNAPFDTPKPVRLIVKLLQLGFVEKNDIVLDFFSGSATTAHAVMQLNAEDGGSRKFVLAQLDEPTPENSEARKAGYNSIPEIARERIRRAGKKIQGEILKQVQDDKGVLPGMESAESRHLDIGFRSFKIDSTNMKDVYYGAGEITQAQLGDFISNIKDDRSDEDLLYQVILQLGLTLDLPHEVLDIDSVKVHKMAGNFLVACFVPNISEDLVKAIANLKPFHAVFRDSSFASSQNKINLTEIFKLLSPETDIKVI